MILAPCIGCQGTLAEQARAYAALFPGSRIGGRDAADWQPAEGQIYVTLELEGCMLALLDAGPRFRPNPGISLFVQRETAAEVDAIWDALIEGGEVLVARGAYPWSPRYGFLTDRFGVSWQISQGPVSDVGQAITPAIVYSGAQLGQARAALAHYDRAFPGATVDGILEHDGSGPDAAGTVLHAQIRLPVGTLMLMDSAEAEGWTFGWGTSLMVICDTQDQIEALWTALLADGGEPEECGWLRDPFGLSWQVTPGMLLDLTEPGRPGYEADRAARVNAAMMQMVKLEIPRLEAAARG